MIRDVADDAAEDRVAQVRVLELSLRSARERYPLAQEFGEFRLRQRLLTVAPRVVRDEARNVIKKITDTDLRRIVRRVFPATHLGDIVGRRGIKTQLAVVPQLQHGECRERLRHRRNAENGVGGHRPLCREVLHTERTDVHQATVHHDPVYESGNVRVELIRPEDLVGRSVGIRSRGGRRLRQHRGYATGAGQERGGHQA